ncbi:MAG: CBS domain-containing protein [Planctomycetaceae bacterium]
MLDETDELQLRRILKSARVGELTLATRPALAPSDTLAAAARDMRRASHGSAFVCVDGKLVGIFTERDLLRAISRGVNMEIELSQAMSRDPKTVTANDTLFDALRFLDEGGYRRLPVVDDSGSPVGIVDVKTIVHFLVEYFPGAVYNQAPQKQLIPEEREGA